MEIKNTLWGTVENPGFFRSKSVWAAIITAVALAALGALIMTGVLAIPASLLLGTSAALFAAAGLTLLITIVLFAVKSGKKTTQPNGENVHSTTSNSSSTDSKQDPKTPPPSSSSTDGTRNTGFKVLDSEQNRIGATVTQQTNHNHVQVSGNVSLDD